MDARDVMTTAVVTVRPQTSVEEVAKLLLERRISAVPVVDDKARVLGIVSEGDLIRPGESGAGRSRSWWLALLASRDEKAFDYVKSHGRTAGDVMARKVVTVTERTPLAKIATLLERHRIKRVPVVRSGKIVGIVSRANLLHGLVAQKAAGSTASVNERGIRTRVIKAIEQAGVHRSWVNVIVPAKGVVELWGFVETAQQKRALALAAKGVKGVKRVVDNVMILPAMPQVPV